MKPYIHTSTGAYAFFQWNIDASVGKGGQNSSPCDIAYIQWYYTLAARHPETPPERKAIYGKVRVTGICRGTDDDPLVAAIMAHQKGINHSIIDGKVSVAQGSGKIGDKAYFVLRIGARLANMYPGLWPRLDLMPDCPPQVASAARAAIPSV